MSPTVSFFPGVVNFTVPEKRSESGKPLCGCHLPSFSHPSTVLHPKSVTRDAETVQRHSRIRKIQGVDSRPPKFSNSTFFSDQSARESIAEEGRSERKAKLSQTASVEFAARGDTSADAQRMRNHTSGNFQRAPSPLTADVDCEAAILALRKRDRVQRPSVIPPVFPSTTLEPSLLFKGFHPLRCPPRSVALSRRMARPPKDTKPVSWERHKRSEQEKQDVDDTKRLAAIKVGIAALPCSHSSSTEYEDHHSAAVEKKNTKRNREHQVWKLQLALQLIKRTNLYKLFVRLCDYRTRIHLLMQQADFIVKALDNEVGNLEQPTLVLGYHPLVWMLSISSPTFTSKDLTTHFTVPGGVTNTTTTHRQSSVVVSAAAPPSATEPPVSKGVSSSFRKPEEAPSQRREGIPFPPLKAAIDPFSNLEGEKQPSVLSPPQSPRSSILPYLRSDEDRAVFHLLSQIGVSYLPHATTGGKNSGSGKEPKSGVAVLLDILLAVMTKPPMMPLNMEEFHRVLTDTSHVLRREMILMQVVLNRLQERITKRKNTLAKEFLRGCSNFFRPHVKPDEVLKNVMYDVPTELELLLVENPQLLGSRTATWPSKKSPNLAAVESHSNPHQMNVAVRNTMTVKTRSTVGINTERTVEEVELWFRFVSNFHVTGVSTLKVEHVLESVAVIMADVSAPLLLPECAYQIWGYNGIYSKEIGPKDSLIFSCPTIQATRLPEDDLEEDMDVTGREKKEYLSCHECSEGRGKSGLSKAEINRGGSEEKKNSSARSRTMVATCGAQTGAQRSISSKHHPSLHTKEELVCKREEIKIKSDLSSLYYSTNLSCALFALDVLGHDPLHVHHDLEFALEEISQLLHYARTLCAGRRVENQIYRENTCVHDQEKRHELEALLSLWDKEMDVLLDFMWRGELRVGNVHFIHSLLKEHAPNMYQGFREEHRTYLSGYLSNVSGETFSSLVSRYNPFRQCTTSNYVRSDVQKNYPNNFLIMSVCHESLAQLKECENIVYWVMIRHYRAAMKAYREKVKRLEGLHAQQIPPKGPLIIDPERMETATTPGYHLNEKANPLLLPHCSTAIQILSWLEKLVGYQFRHFTPHGQSSNSSDWVKSGCGDGKTQLRGGRQESIRRLSGISHSRTSSTSSSVSHVGVDDVGRETENNQYDSTRSTMLRTVKGACGFQGKTERTLTKSGVMDCFIVTNFNRQLYEAPENSDESIR